MTEKQKSELNKRMRVFKAWAPDTALWTDWAKPVLFAGLKDNVFDGDFTVPKNPFLPSADRRTMVIIDLPGKSGVAAALALSRVGYRPVPLYNGVRGTGYRTIIDVREIDYALQAGASELEGLRLRDDAPPAFLLDSRRMDGLGKQKGSYDNRWCVFPQDMPSADFLIKAGIDRVVVRSDKIRDDLSHILCRYQKQGIKILQCVRAKSEAKAEAKAKRDGKNSKNQDNSSDWRKNYHDNRQDTAIFSHEMHHDNANIRHENFNEKQEADDEGESGNYTLSEVTVNTPSRFSSLRRRFSVTLGLTRNSAGGFGGKIPEPAQYTSGGTGFYYGIG